MDVSVGFMSIEERNIVFIVAKTKQIKRNIKKFASQIKWSFEFENEHPSVFRDIRHIFIKNINKLGYRIVGRVKFKRSFYDRRSGLLSCYAFYVGKRKAKEKGFDRKIKLEGTSIKWNLYSG